LWDVVSYTIAKSLQDQLFAMANISDSMSDIVTFQNNLMHYLNRADLANMRLAGIAVPLSATVQGQNLIKSQCCEGNVHRCPNTSHDLVRMTDCEGALSDKRRYDEPPHRSADGFWNELSKFLHKDFFQVCEPCRIQDKNASRDSEREVIAGFHTGLCKQHDRRFRKQGRGKPCRCYEFVRGGWKCWNDARITMYVLGVRANSWRNELLFTHLESGKGWTRRKGRGRGRRVVLDYTRVRRQPACPIPGCGKAQCSTGSEDVACFCLACCGEELC